MFKLVEERRTWATVTFPQFTDTGERVEIEVEMQFLLLPLDDYIKLLAEAENISLELGAGNAEDVVASDRKPSQIFAAFGMRIIRDWRGIGEANGDPTKFDEAALARFFNVPATWAATMRAYRIAVEGVKDARTGN